MKQTLTHSRQLGHILRARRKALRLTQRDLATKLAITQHRLSQIETDPSALPLGRLLDLSNILGLDLIVQDRQSTSKTDW
jgi:HTH-type transcriptional regulator / antitoxin HipB